MMADPFEQDIRCWVWGPDRVRTETWSDGRPLPIGAAPIRVSISDGSGSHSWGMVPAGIYPTSNVWSDDPGVMNPRRFDPVGDPMANALLYPGWRLLGLTETARRPVISELGRPSTEIELVPTIPWSDPRTLGAPDLPHEVENAAPLIVVEDDETGAVVEWRELFEGQVYHRHWWTELELGVDLDPALFDVSVTPELRPWDGPFRSTVEIAPPTEPPTVTIEDAADPSVRQTGRIVGRLTREDHADVASPFPVGVGPFGQSVVLRMDTRAMPISAPVFLFEEDRDQDRKRMPTMLNLLPEHISSEDPVAGRFVRDQNAMIVSQITLPAWSGQLRVRMHVSWSSAMWHGASPFPSVSAEYAFTLDS